MSDGFRAASWMAARGRSETVAYRPEAEFRTTFFTLSEIVPLHYPFATGAVKRLPPALLALGILPQACRPFPYREANDSRNGESQCSRGNFLPTRYLRKQLHNRDVAKKGTQDFHCCLRPSPIHLHFSVPTQIPSRILDR